MNSTELYYQKRHTFLINKELQLRFVAFVIIILIGYSSILLIFQKLAKLLLFPLMIPLVFGGLIIFIGIVSIFYSHRIAGPLFAIQRTLKEISEGELLTEVHIRKEHHSIFHQITENINKITENYRILVLKMDKRLNILLKETQSLSEKVKNGESKDKITVQVQEMLKMEKELTELLRSLRVR